MISSSTSPVLEVTDLGKVYPPSIIALTGVNFSVREGEVLALLGSNGAGKSTITKLLTGIEIPTTGALHIKGCPAVELTPSKAMQMGVEAVYQELPQALNLSAADNIGLGRNHGTKQLFRIWPGRRWFNRYNEIAEEILDSPPGEAILGQLSVGARQKVALIRALASSPSLLIIDEGISSVGVAERTALQNTIRQMCQNRRMGVIYITHFIEDALTASDKVIVLRDGKIVLTGDSQYLSVSEIVREIGANTSDAESKPARDLGYERSETTKQEGKATKRFKPKQNDESHPDGSDLSSLVGGKTTPLLLARNLKGKKWGPVSFELETGMWLGIYGAPGSGGDELLEALGGIIPISGGDVYWCGEQVGRRRSREVRNAITYVTGDRRSAVITSWSVADNIEISTLNHRRALALTTRRAAIGAAKTIIANYNVVGNASSPITTLSGGNQQKLIIGSALSRSGQVLLANDITRGVDVVARANIHKILQMSLAKENLGIIMYSSDAEELVTVCDRILVFRAGLPMVFNMAEHHTVTDLVRASLSRDAAAEVG